MANTTFNILPSIDGKQYSQYPAGNYIPAPTGLTASASGSLVTLDFTDNTLGLATNILRRSTSLLGTYSDVATLAAGVAHYVDTPPTSGTYYYQVTAYFSGAPSAASNTANATIAAVVAPTLASPSMTSDGANITFSGGSGYTTLIPQYSSNAGATWTSIANDTASPLTYSGLSAGSYSFRALANGTAATNVVTGTVAAASAFAPNLPAGFTTVIDRQFLAAEITNTAGAVAQATDSLSCVWTIITAPVVATPASLGISSPPDGAAQILQIKYPNGQAAGYTPFVVEMPFSGVKREYYHACYVWMPSGFNSNGNNIKWIFHAQNGAGRNHVLMLSSGGTSDYQGPWMSLQAGGALTGNQNVGGRDNGTTMVYHLSGTPSNVPGFWGYQQGKWVHVEWYCKMETTPGVTSDGIFKCWMDNTLIEHASNLQYDAVGDPAGFDTITFAPYYGGGGGAAPSAQSLYVSRFLVSAKV